LGCAHESDQQAAGSFPHRLAERSLRRCHSVSHTVFHEAQSDCQVCDRPCLLRVACLGDHWAIASFFAAQFPGYLDSRDRRMFVVSYYCHIECGLQIVASFKTASARGLKLSKRFKI
jgi:hypothetical protein